VRDRHLRTSDAGHPQEQHESQPMTKTRLRRGEIGREKNLPDQSAEIIDFLPPVHGDIEDLLCDLSDDAEGGKQPDI